MHQYLFNKKELLKLIKASPATDDVVAVSVGFDAIKKGKQKHVIAKITANTAKHHKSTGKLTINAKQPASGGCPYPPGCSTE